MATQPQPSTRPAWQTDELQDEWIDLEPDDDEGDKDDQHATGSISLTVPVATRIHTNSDRDLGQVSAQSPVGTFLIREDIPNAPLPKAAGQKKAAVKDIFTPLPLERMFEPPSPPPPHLESDGYAVSTNQPSTRHAHATGTTASLASIGRNNPQFTFVVPKSDSLHSNQVHFALPQQPPDASRSPLTTQSFAPNTDPRLRLFQFHYDTYTRDHLSAIVDSIAVNSPSGTTTASSPSSFRLGASQPPEPSKPASSFSHLRSTKRVKLSPPSDFDEDDIDESITIARPRLAGRDYIGESKSLMQQIKQARDFSTTSTTKTSGPPLTQSNRASINSIPNANSDSGRAKSSSINSVKHQNSTPTDKTVSSSLTYRQQAAALMAQIRNDMKGQKRLLSGDEDVSYITTSIEDKDKPSQSSSRGTTNCVTSTEKGGPHDQANQRSLTSSTLAQDSASGLGACSNQLNSRKISPQKRVRNRATSRRSTASDYSEKILSQRLSGISIGHNPQSAEEPAPIQVETRKSQNEQHQASVFLAPPTRAPPLYPSSVHGNTNDDLNRFVSSSTASGTTLTAGSAPSFVKHSGPARIRTIAPGDVPALPDRLGDMLFDKTLGRWVKSTAGTNGVEEGLPVEDGSEDPFGDIESLRDESRGREDEPIRNESRANGRPRVGLDSPSEQSDVDDEEELELTSFSTDDAARSGGASITEGEEDMSTESEGDEDESATEPSIPPQQAEHEAEQSEPSIQQTDIPIRESCLPSSRLPMTPMPSSNSAGSTPSIKSALKSSSVTPTSALKDPNGALYQTPMHKPSNRRSVSFSDGKRDGPIRGLNGSTSSCTDGESDRTQSSTVEDASAAGSAIRSSTFLPSARSKRIADMMGALIDTDSDGNSDSSSKMGDLDNSQPDQPPPVAPAASTKNLDGGSLDSKKGRPSNRTPSTGHPRSLHEDPSINKGNATFLTECSFGVAHDRLVEVITDVQPFEPYWENLASIDLSRKDLESVTRLKEFLPRLDALNLNANQLAWLSGVPGSVRTLSVSTNRLTGLTSFNHLSNLENLDVSRNDINSLQQLACLRHLRELKADGNQITSVDGLEHMDGLVKLSLQGNNLQSVDLAQCRWTRLEMLNMSKNRLESICGLASLPSLVALNLDNNQLTEVKVDGPMPRLRILRISSNRLQQLRVGSILNLRTLYADNNSLSNLIDLARLTKLENLSLRNQSGGSLHLNTRDIRDIKRLYLSGNPLKTKFFEEPCYNLIYLELAACRLTALPEEISSLVPNLRVLNLNYNFLEDARPLEGLTRLRKLTIIGSRLKGTKPLIRLLQKMPDVEMLDFRMNPCTLGWYLPLLVRDVPGALQPSEGVAGEKEVGGQTWQDLDAKFRRDLPDESYIGRLAYRGLIMRACTRIRMLDGIEVSEKERAKAHHLLLGIMNKAKKSKGHGAREGS